MKKILLILLLLLHVGAAQGSHPDYEAMEREMIARAKLIELVFWGEETIGEHRATLSESDKRRIQDLLLNRTRYIKPLEMSREEYWDGWDDGIVAPVRFLKAEYYQTGEKWSFEPCRHFVLSVSSKSQKLCLTNGENLL